MPELIPGVFSSVGRSTEPDIAESRTRAGQQDVYGHVNAEDAGKHNARPNEARPKGKAKASGQGSPSGGGGPSLGKGAAQGDAKCGELERAIQERIRLKSMLKPKEVVEEPPPEPEARSVQQSAFSAQGFDSGLWSSKFTASRTPGALGRSKEPQTVDPGWYRPQYGSVHGRNPAWDIRGGGSRGPKQGAEEEASHSSSPSPKRPGWSLTALDDMEELVKDVRDVRDEREPPKSQLALAPPRPDPWKMNPRAALSVNEVSCVPPEMLRQDIKAHRSRAPEWDFARVLDRPPMHRPDDGSSGPGKYDVPWGNGVISVAAKSGVAFDRGISRAQSQAGQLGHGAPAAGLLPEGVRNPGIVCAPDRSRAKDVVRTRVAYVNDFAKELGRPNYARTDQAQSLENEETLHRIMTYDPNTAELPVRQRKDIARLMAGMSNRGRQAVQGVRALQTDLGLRGSVGMGFQETSVQCSDVECVESRAADGARERADKGPHLERYSGRYGAPSLSSSPKKGSLRQPLPSNAAFERKASAPGFMAKAAFGGRSAAVATATNQRSQSCSILDTLPDWDSELRASKEE